MDILVRLLFNDAHSVLMRYLLRVLYRHQCVFTRVLFRVSVDRARARRRPRAVWGPGCRTDRVVSSRWRESALPNNRGILATGSLAGRGGFQSRVGEEPRCADVTRVEGGARARTHVASRRYLGNAQYTTPLHHRLRSAAPLLHTYGEHVGR